MQVMNAQQCNGPKELGPAWLAGPPCSNHQATPWWSVGLRVPSTGNPSSDTKPLLRAQKVNLKTPEGPEATVSEPGGVL